MEREVARLTVVIDEQGNVLLELPAPVAGGPTIAVRRRGNWAQINVTAAEGAKLDVRPGSVFAAEPKGQSS